MQIETAKASLLGDREENQDRVGVLRRGDSLLAVVLDGMGGHSRGDLAAQVALDCMLKKFAEAKLPLMQEQRFLSELIFDAHEAVIKAGAQMSMDMMPRATAAVCLIQRDRMLWAHVGDSRLYHTRKNKLLTRTRDHTHVEMLLQQGLIKESQINEHPMRNYVESCLGGEIEMSILTESGPMTVEAGDRIMLCSDGLWSAFSDTEIAEHLSRHDMKTQDMVENMCELAVNRCFPMSDNTSVVVLKINET
ncbi:MAG: serine/threonine-protein phosphatase [Gammaproteobacteria bacterium]|nr:serine/threonine-protein phosphatase [Gammaproteobacteria bacterium]NNC97946.1 serine/threonine-protein phosphatase [Gammaproteobacteria bacterium]NNM14256.1 serine/threonine-protein phosphatase [Gammaproteobacteria bacterium]